MALNGQEAVGSMGNDAPLAVLSDHHPLLFNYFKQLFAQVTNPPVDPIREELVMSAETTIGAEQNLFEEGPLHCRQLRLKQPILTNDEMEKIKRLAMPGLRSITLSTLYNPRDGEAGIARGPGAAVRERVQGDRRRLHDHHPVRPRSGRRAHGDSVACSPPAPCIITWCAKAPARRPAW